jgi:hypothetical protein
LQLFYFFFLFGLFGFVETFAGGSEDMRILLQSLKQIWGMIYTPIAHKFRLPSKNNYTCKSNYILPFNGKWVVVNGGVDKALSHSWSIYPQRYAYDFIVMDDEGNFSAGDKSSLQSYYCYGKDIIAPADGEVVKVSHHHKDSRVDGKKVYCDATDISGNHIVIKHNEYEYSMIAHLMPNSVTVSAGDIVKQGEIIAKCGNSGNTSMPHIHFQLQSNDNIFLAAGLPIIFTNISAQDKVNYKSIDIRSCQNNLQVIGSRSFIGRGLEVENGKSSLNDSKKADTIYIPAFPSLPNSNRHCRFTFLFVIPIIAVIIIAPFTLILGFLFPIFRIHGGFFGI